MFFIIPARFFAQFLRDQADCDIMAVAGFLEIRPPPAEASLTSELFVSGIAKGVALDYSCWRSDLVEVQPPPADLFLSLSYLLPRNARMIKNFLLLEVEPRHKHFRVESNS